MKQFILVVASVLMGGGVGLAQKSEVRTIGSFNGIKTAEAVDVFLKKGDKESIRVETTSTKLSDVLTEISGSYLKIHMRDGFHRNDDVKVYVTYTIINKISASSASNVYSDGSLKANSMEIEVSSAASVELTIDAVNLEASASSAGDIELEGKVSAASYEVSTAGEIDAYNVKAEKVLAEASSGGAVKLSVTNELVANASSGGSVRYRGNPAKSMTNSTSGGSVKKSSE